MEKRFFQTSSGMKMPYVFYRHGEKTGEKLPMIVYLHGTDGCGDDPQRIFDIQTMVSYIVEGKMTIEKDMVLLTPQCPVDMNWDKVSEETVELIHHVIETENVDPDRVSLIGCSLGGMGTFSIGIKHPELFSALVPVCGSIKEPERCKVLTSMPVRIFHGTEDTGMGFSVVDAARVINEAGGNCELNMLEGHGHEIRWVYYDKDFDIVNWMIAQKRK